MAEKATVHCKPTTVSASPSYDCIVCLIALRINILGVGGMHTSTQQYCLLKVNTAIY